MDLYAKPLVLPPSHHGTIFDTIRRDVQDEPLGNNHARLHP